jgi:RNA polymerase subunit RPABC4/transcription elongation factor Spt4
MFDQLFGGLDTTLSDFIESDIVQIGLRVLVIYFLLIWLASAFWAYRDMRLRTASAVAPYIAAGTIILFTPIFFLFGLLLYRIVRPKETIAEVSERALAEEAILAEVATHAHCANCSRPVHEDWIICPTCRNRLRRVCPNCEHLIELDWTLCAWCGKDFERAEAPGTAAFMPTARPAPRPQQLPPPRPAPAPARVPAPPAQQQTAPAQQQTATGQHQTPSATQPASASGQPSGGATAASSASPSGGSTSTTSQTSRPPQQPAPRSAQAGSGSTQASTGER